MRQVVYKVMVDEFKYLGSTDNSQKITNEYIRGTAQADCFEDNIRARLRSADET